MTRFEKNFTVGRTFTPLNWAKWLVVECGAFSCWRNGGTILDPASGAGAFLEAFMAVARDRGHTIDSKSLARLHGIEIVPEDRDAFLSRIAAEYGIDFPIANFVVGDVLEPKFDRKFDWLVGNPPWANYADIPDAARKRWSNEFVDSGLVASKRDVLLGKSRTDLCALVVKKCLDRNLATGGQAGFFVPLSLLFNDGANDRFRPFPGSGHGYAVKRVWDFAGTNVFGNVATRYGALEIARGQEQCWPVRTMVRRDGTWRGAFSSACDGKSGGWIRHSRRTGPPRKPVVTARRESKPRQGANACGATRAFQFEKMGGAMVDADGNEAKIERALLFPLMGKSQFGGDTDGASNREKWILLPHDIQTGAPLSWDELARYPKVRAHLSRHEGALKRRKGAYIQGHVRRGHWWALLGIGQYSFAPWKVAWESLGKRAFRPVILDGRWQGNQAMHAYCPCNSRAEAERLHGQLANPRIEEWLKSFSMEGTCNWAQPGKVSRLFDYSDKAGELDVRQGT